MTVTNSPTIISRQAWGANPLVTPAGAIATPTLDLWLHHTGGSGSGAGYMRSLQQGALRGGYVDLEYTLVVDNRDGAIYMSRGPGRNTAATGGSTGGVANNARSHAICAMGNFENETPTPALLDGIASCVLWLAAQRAIATPVITGPHTDAPGNATACCGRNLIAQIGAINQRAAGGGGGTAPAPAPDTGGGPLTAIASPQRGNPAGRTPTARPVPALGAILLENGAALSGDKPSGANRVWTSSDAAVQAAGNKLLDIAPTIGADGRPDGRGVVALFDLGNNQVGTYTLPWS